MPSLLTSGDKNPRSDFRTAKHRIFHKDGESRLALDDSETRTMVVMATRPILVAYRTPRRGDYLFACEVVLVPPRPHPCPSNSRFHKASQPWARPVSPGEAR